MSEYAAFLAVVVVVLAVPGPDTLVVLRTALADGARSGIWAAAGSAAGMGLWGHGSGVGVAALLAASATAFSVLKLAHINRSVRPSRTPLQRGSRAYQTRRA